jgi:hypothetical protein
VGRSADEQENESESSGSATAALLNGSGITRDLVGEARDEILARWSQESGQGVLEGWRNFRAAGLSYINRTEAVRRTQACPQCPRDTD